MIDQMIIYNYILSLELNQTNKISIESNFEYFTEVNECLSKPCKNNGTCQNTDVGVSCVCQPGFTGKFCEKGKKSLLLFFNINRDDTY